jgi:putative FmdB family regulatory protein
VPIYDYLCSSCRQLTEVIHGIDAPGPRFCPACGAEGTLRKAFAPPTVHFKGSGWAKKDRSSSTRTRTRPAADAASGDGRDAAGKSGEGAASGAAASDSGGSSGPASDSGRGRSESGKGPSDSARGTSESGKSASRDPGTSRHEHSSGARTSGGAGSEG